MRRDQLAQKLEVAVGDQAASISQHGVHAEAA
jgi:hypothetical protein